VDAGGGRDNRELYVMTPEVQKSILFNLQVVIIMQRASSIRMPQPKLISNLETIKLQCSPAADRSFSDRKNDVYSHV
jgi:hypothetical protein